MSWISLLTLLLQLVAWVARQADKLETERAVLNELELLQHVRVKAAEDARDDVLSGRVQPDDNDPNKRD